MLLFTEEEVEALTHMPPSKEGGMPGHQVLLEGSRQRCPLLVIGSCTYPSLSGKHPALRLAHSALQNPQVAADLCDRAGFPTQRQWTRRQRELVGLLTSCQTCASQGKAQLRRAT